MSDTNIQAELLTEAALSQLLGCAKSTIKSAIRDGRIPAVRFGDESVVPVRALVDELNRAAEAEMLQRRPSCNNSSQMRHFLDTRFGETAEPEGLSVSVPVPKRTLPTLAGSL